MRVCIHTANYVSSDWDGKSQGIWVQDFPKLTEAYKGSCDVNNLRDFGHDLYEYFSFIGGWNVSRIMAHDFRFATADIVASVPGYHKHHRRKVSVAVTESAEGSLTRQNTEPLANGDNGA